jgi:hypothetical protein
MVALDPRAVYLSEVHNEDDLTQVDRIEIIRYSIECGRQAFALIAPI